MGEVELQPNVFYHIELTPGLEEMAITLAPSTNYEIVNEYVFQIDASWAVVGDMVLSFPAGIIWKDGDIPTLQEAECLVVSIVNNLGVYAKF